MTTMNTALYTSVRDAGMSIAHVCEVGVYLPDTSNVLGWIQTGVRTTLVECDPTVVAALRARFGTLNHVTIHDVAVADEVGMLTLYRTGASTFGSNVPSAPALVNDAYRPNERDAFMVQCVTFAAIDDGTIDVLSIDIEGGEWYVLKHMISRPHVISIETHGKYYVNPYMEQIDAWMQAHGYGAWYRDKSDTVFRLGWMEPVVDRTPPLRAFARFKRWLRGR